jgi:hypothetical protein
VRIAGEIGEHGLRSGERALGVDVYGASIWVRRRRRSGWTAAAGSGDKIAHDSFAVQAVFDCR